MKRILLALLFLCPLAASATDIYVSVTYTAGAATAAGGGTAIQTQVSSIINGINTAYANSGIGIHLVPFYEGQPTKGAPPDSASMQEQFKWAQNSVPALQAKTFSDASFSVQISNPGLSVTTGAIPATIPTASRTAVAALPYSFLGTQLEFALSTMIGANHDGYAVRSRTWPADPIWHGAAVCRHSREAGSSDPATQVPNLPYYWRSAGSSTNDGSTAATSCEQLRADLVTGGGAPNTYYSSSVSVVSSTEYRCSIKNNFGIETVGTSTLYFTGAGGSSAVSCSDTTMPVYSSPSIPIPNTTLYLGDSTHDSVGAMNARASTVAAFPSTNPTLLKRAKAGIFESIWNSL